MRNLIVMVLLATACASAPVLAQDGVYIQLTTDETAQAKAAYEAKTKADANWEEVKRQIEHKYKMEDSSWNPGFQFSKDFRVILPKRWYPETGSISNYPCPFGVSSLTTVPESTSTAVPTTSTSIGTSGAVHY